MLKNILTVLLQVGRKIRGHFFAGILLIVPLGVTIGIFSWLFASIDGILQPLVRTITGYTIPGVGFGATLLLIYVAGVIVSNVVGRRLVGYGEAALGRIPVARYLYNGVRQIISSFTNPDTTGFMQVVLIEFPRRGTRTLGFITNEVVSESGKKLLNVFIPTSPNPTSGFLQIVDETEIIRTGISVDDALKMIVSGGRMSPKEVSEKLFVGDSVP
ncbi:MAG: DUF502 domain-containing protein [Dehalococcoidales bacterium]